MNAGELGIDNATAIGSGAFTINGGSFDNTSSAAITLSNNNVQTWGGDFTFVGTQNLNLGTGAVTLGSSRQVTVSANTLTVGGLIGDGGSGYALTKAGAGTLVLTGANTFGGATTVGNGTLSVNAIATSTTPQPLGESAGLTIGGATTGGTLLFTGGTGSTLDKNITLGAGGGTVASSGNAAISLSGFIIGSSNLTLNNASSTNTLNLSGGNNSNSFTGNLIITAGQIRPGSTTQLNGSNTVSIQSGAQFNFGSSSGVTIAGLNDIAGATGGLFTGGSSNPVLTLAGSGSYAFSGVISIGDTGGLKLSGSGTQDLSGINTYGGPTQITSGTLIVDATTNASAALTSTSSIKVSTGGDLHLLSTLATGQGSGTVSMINAAAPLTISGSGTQVTLDLGGAVQPVASFTIGSTNQGAGYFGSSAFFAANTQYTDANSNDDAYFSGDGGISVPEPGSIGLLALGGLGLMRRRRCRAANGRVQHRPASTPV